MTDLRHRLESKGWTQRDLARKTGLSTTYVNELVNGTANDPSARVVASLAVAFGCSMESIMSDPSSDPTDERQFYIRMTEGEPDTTIGFNRASPFKGCHAYRWVDMTFYTNQGHLTICSIDLPAMRDLAKAINCYADFIVNYSDPIEEG